GIASTHADRMASDLNQNDSSIPFPVPPQLGSAQPRYSLGYRVHQLRNLHLGPDVRNRHREKFLSRVAVVADGRFVDRKKLEVRAVKNPHGHGVAIKEKPILVFGGVQCLVRYAEFQRALADSSL